MTETMTPRERATLHRYINAATRYLEFGTGLSTVYACASERLATIDAVESSRYFFDQHLARMPPVRSAITAGRLRLHLVDIGETREFGHPIDDTKRDRWPDYSHAVFRYDTAHDLVLVDGRFRVACALNAATLERDGAVILVHDFWNRPWYHGLLDFLDVIDRVDTLAVFRRKSDLDVTAARAVIDRYKYLPADGRPEPHQHPTRARKVAR